MERLKLIGFLVLIFLCLQLFGGAKILLPILFWFVIIGLIIWPGSDSSNPRLLKLFTPFWILNLFAIALIIIDKSIVSFLPHEAGTADISWVTLIGQLVIIPSRWIAHHKRSQYFPSIFLITSLLGAIISFLLDPPPGTEEQWISGIEFLTEITLSAYLIWKKEELYPSVPSVLS